MSSNRSQARKNFEPGQGAFQYFTGNNISAIAS